MTNAMPILQPVAALMVLTLVVWVAMYWQRLRFVVAHRVPVQDLASPAAIDVTLPEQVNRPSNNLKNLFELPVVFYAVCLALQVVQQADAGSVALAWAYVGLRAVHSAIHCSVNIVALRFVAHVLSSIVLWVMVVRFVMLVA